VKTEAPLELVIVFTADQFLDVMPCDEWNQFPGAKAPTELPNMAALGIGHQLHEVSVSSITNLGPVIDGL
jgi:hypothetical protein